MHRFTTIACLGLIFACAISRADEPGERLVGRSAAEWAAELESDAASQRHLAAWALAQIGLKAQVPLFKALGHDDPTVRFWGVRGLALLKEQLEPIAEKLPRGSDELLGVGAVDKAVFNELRDRLKDKSPPVRLAAAEALTRWNVQYKIEGLGTLVAALSDPQEAVRIAAIDSLDKLGPLAAPAAADIEQATADPSEYVKRISARIVARLTGQAAP